jgi:hypothetical protein
MAGTHRVITDDELPGTQTDTGHAEMSEYQDGTSPDADYRHAAAIAGRGFTTTAGFTPAQQRASRLRSLGYQNRWEDGLRMLAVTAERLATDADRAEATGYLATIPADSELRRLD